LLKQGNARDALVCFLWIGHAAIFVGYWIHEISTQS
jgi:hypothetical protein